MLALENYDPVDNSNWRLDLLEMLLGSKKT